MISYLIGGYAKYEQIIWNVNFFRENNRACTYFLKYIFGCCSLVRIEIRYSKKNVHIIVFVLEPRRTRALRCALLTPSLFSSEVVHFLLSFSLPIVKPVQKTAGIQNQDWYLSLCFIFGGGFCWWRSFLAFSFLCCNGLLREPFLLINVLETVGVCSYL